VYPPENKRLYELICASGACISEFPLNYEALAENFPVRNRTIAGLSLATLVVEAGVRSGALITARCALENDREVMAVPGRIDSPLNKGPHQLLRQGATLVESIDDIIDALGPIRRQIQEHIDSLSGISETAGTIDIETRNLSPHEKSICACLSKDPVHIDHIIQETRLPTGTVNASLVSLQLKGMVKNVPGNRFMMKS
jgi:DNA processing protein